MKISFDLFKKKKKFTPLGIEMQLGVEKNNIKIKEIYFC